MWEKSEFDVTPEDLANDGPSLTEALFGSDGKPPVYPDVTQDEKLREGVPADLLEDHRKLLDLQREAVETAYAAVDTQVTRQALMMLLLSKLNDQPNREIFDMLVEAMQPHLVKPPSS